MKQTGAVGCSEQTVSVVIPTYNRADLLGAAIRSVLNQTHPVFEIIVVDDCSTNNTRQVVEELQDSRIKYIRHDKNKGGSAARNTGIRAATGDYIAFLDDDDEWRPEKIARQLEAMGEFDVMLCAAVVKSKNAKRQSYDKTSVDVRDLRKGFVFGGGTGILLAKQFVLKNSLFDENLPCSQDWDLLVRIARKHSVGYIDEALVIYNDGGHRRITNESKEKSIADMEKQMRAIYKHREFLGPLWFKYHVARRLLSYMKDRDKKAWLLMHTIKRCGIFPVLMVMAEKVRRRLPSFRYSGP